MEILKNAPLSKWINRYSISIVLFVLWIGVFDKYSWLKQAKVEHKIHTLQQHKNEYENLLEEAKIEHEDILKNKEKYAREKYFLHKKGEEVFVIEQNQ
jgi:cell division protein FtsB